MHNHDTQVRVQKPLVMAIPRWGELHDNRDKRQKHGKQ